MRNAVGSDGQVVIPQKIRAALGIGPGHSVSFELRGDEIVIRTSTPVPLLGRFAGQDLSGALTREKAADRDFDQLAF